MILSSVALSLALKRTTVTFSVIQSPSSRHSEKTFSGPSIL